MALISAKKGILDVILYLVVFIVVQLIITYAGIIGWAIYDGQSVVKALTNTTISSNYTLIALTTVFSSLITLIVFLKTKWTPVTRDYLQSKPWFTLFWVFLFTVGTIIPLEFVYEHLGLEMDENASKLFEGLLKEPWGYVAVGVLAPLAEEVVFRGAILRTLLAMMSKKNHWVAIMISAALFGLVHGNTAQFVNALLIGLVLGWMYYRTKSLVPGILLHWVNNTVAYILTNLVPKTDGKLIDLFGGDEKVVYYAVGFSLCILIPSFIQLVGRLKKA